MNLQLTPNFNLSEFQSRDGAPMPPDVRTNVEHLAQQLQVIRDHIGRPLAITSGYRSEAHTRKLISQGIKTSLKSYHVTGKAADLKAGTMSAKELAATITALMIEGKITAGGVGLYSTWVHYDTRGHHVRFR